MATIQDAIKRLTYVFTSTGADKVADDLNKVGAAQANVAASAQTTTTASLSLEKSFDNLERRYVSTVRAQQDFEKVQNTVNSAVAQNPQLQDRANVVLDSARAKFDAAKGSAAGFNSVLESGRGALLGYAAGIGPIGAVLGSFGPWGVAAAAGIGLVSAALNYMSENAAKIGDASSTLQRFADNAGLTTTQVRGLNEAGSQLGISSDVVGGAIEKLTVNLADARKGSGELYTQLQAIDGQLANDIASTHSSAEALDILAKAYNSTTDATTKAALARAAFGRGGVSSGGILGEIGDAGGVDAYSAAVQKALGVTDEWTKKVAALRNENKSLEEDLKLIEASTYSQGVLERQNQFLKTQIQIAQYFKNNPAQVYLSQDSGMIPDQATAGGSAGNNGGASTAAATGGAAAASAAQQFQTLAQAQQDVLNATIKLAGEESRMVSALGAEATAAEKEQARVEALTASLLSGSISAETFNRALDSQASRAAAAATAIGQAYAGVGEQTALALRALDNALPVAEAWTNSAKMLAQEQATINNLLDKGATLEEASALAAKQYETSKAAAVAAAQKTVQSSQDQVDLLRVQGTEMEGVTQASIAYRDAMQSGATATQAAAIYSNTLEANLLRAAAAADQLAVNEANAKTSADLAFVQKNGIFAPTSGNANTASSLPLVVTPEGYQTANDPISLAIAYNQQQYGTADAPNTRAASTTTTTGATAASPIIAPISNLTSSVDKLNTSTQQLNSTMGDLLSPYYTQDPRTSHIGFRSQGMADGGYVDVPGGISANDNMIATIPVASGERIYVDAMPGRRGGSSGTTISINMPVTIQGNANKDDIGRTLYQAAQNTARQLAASGR